MGSGLHLMVVPVSMLRILILLVYSPILVGVLGLLNVRLLTVVRMRSLMEVFSLNFDLDSSFHTS